MASTSSSCSVSCPPTLSKAKPGVHHQHGPELAVLQQHHGHGSSDQFLPLTRLTSTLTHRRLSRGGKTGFCCSGSQVAPTLQRKRVPGSNRAGEPGNSRACSLLFDVSDAGDSSGRSDGTPVWMTTPRHHLARALKIQRAALSRAQNAPSIPPAAQITPQTLRGLASLTAYYYKPNSGWLQLCNLNAQP